MSTYRNLNEHVVNVCPFAWNPLPHIIVATATPGIPFAVQTRHGYPPQQPLAKAVIHEKPPAGHVSVHP